MKKCPKTDCGYERQPSDDVYPATECPKCGVIYGKVTLPINTHPDAEQKEKEKSPHRKVSMPEVCAAIIAVLLFFGFVLYANKDENNDEINVKKAITNGSCIEGDCENGFGTFQFWGGKKYIGEWKDGLQHGNGYVLSAAKIYAGEWVNGEENKENIYYTIEPSEGYSARIGGFVGGDTWIEYSSWKDLLMEKIDELDLNMAKSEEYENAHSGIPMGGYIHIKIRRRTIGTANTDNFLYIIKTGETELFRESGGYLFRKTGIYNIPTPMDKSWLSFDIIPFPQRIIEPLKLYIIDNLLKERLEFTITRHP